MASLPYVEILWGSPSEAGSLMQVPNDFTAIPEDFRFLDAGGDCHLKKGR